MTSRVNVNARDCDSAGENLLQKLQKRSSRSTPGPETGLLVTEGKIASAYPDNRSLTGNSSRK